MKIFIHDAKTGDWEIQETKDHLAREYQNARVTEVKNWKKVISVAKNKDKKVKKEIKKPKKNKKK